MKTQVHSARLLFPLICLGLVLVVGAVVTDTNELSLINAVKKRDVNAVAKLIQDPTIDVNAPNKEGHCALFVAVKYGFHDIVDILVRSDQLDVSIRSKNSGWTALHMAVSNSDLKIVKTLLTEEHRRALRSKSSAIQPTPASLHVGDKQGITPLMLAVDKIEIAEVLLEQEPELCQQDNIGQTALHRAVLLHSSVKTHQATQAKAAKFAQLLLEAAAARESLYEIAEEAQRLLFLRTTGDIKMTALEMAISRRDLRMVEIIVNSDCKFPVVDLNGRNLLHQALFEQAAEIFYFLDKYITNTSSDLHIDRQTLCASGRSLLHYAAVAFKPDVLQYIIKNYPELDLDQQTSTSGSTPLMLAITNNREKNVVALVEAGANMDVLDRAGKSARDSAQALCHYNLIKYLDDMAEQRHQASFFPLHAAARTLSHTKMLELLLRHDINEKDSKGYTALHISVLKNDVIGAELLLRQKADTEIAQDREDEFRALHFAVSRNAPKMVELLLRFSADVNAEAMGKIRPIHLAVEARNRKEVLELLINAGAEKHVYTFYGELPEHLIAKAGTADYLPYFCQVSTTGEDSDGQIPSCNLLSWNLIGGSPLALAAAAGHYAVLEQYVILGANVQNYMSAEKYASPLLHRAWTTKDFVLIELLLKLGVNVNSQDTDHNQTLLQKAIIESNLAATSLALRNGADPSIKDKYGRTAFHYAASQSDEGFIKALLSNSRGEPDLEVQTNRGSTPLMVAIRHGNVSVAKYLFHSGARTDCVDHAGNNLRDTAAETRSQAIINLVRDMRKTFALRSPVSS